MNHPYPRFSVWKIHILYEPRWTRVKQFKSSWVRVWPLTFLLKSICYVLLLLDANQLRTAILCLWMRSESSPLIIYFIRCHLQMSTENIVLHAMNSTLNLNIQPFIKVLQKEDLTLSFYLSSFVSFVHCTHMLKRRRSGSISSYWISHFTPWMLF